MPLPKPSKADLLASAGKTLTDLIAPDLRVLFCGINPSLYSGYTGFHFGRPGNRFWSTLHASGFTPRRLLPEQEQELLALGLGITSLVERATTAADELAPAELVAGGQRLLIKVETYRPKAVAILGIGAYRTAFNRPRAVMGRQAEMLGDALLWVLPNPSGLNAHYTPTSLAEVFRQFRVELEAAQSPTA